ncbi:MAG: carboxypeptidase regulatory-like domain-containing protein [Candidatus Electrothrix sp. AR4]|nr:carboxypeptidase regulatory-like domain-containing protein [Candidatus Electrothrix sp. AR4]
MNSFIKKQQLQNNTRKVRSGFFPFILCCFMVISNNAFAQYWDSQPSPQQQYHADIKNTADGGGTWGAILRLSARIKGSTANFEVTSKMGDFYNTNSVSIRSGSHTGVILTSGKITPGSKAAKLQLNLDAVSVFPHRFYATITNDRGQAWVGYVQISRVQAARNNITPPPVLDSPQPTSGPDRPIISDNPTGAAVNTSVTIPVSAGNMRTADLVKIQCTASNSGSTRDNPYVSDWIYAGSTINASFTFYSTGPQSIFCNTHDSYGATSSLTQRMITVTRPQDIVPPAPVVTRPQNFAPPAPVITPPTQAEGETPVSILVAAGTPAYGQPGDVVRISCTAEGSNRTNENPYISPTLQPGAVSDAMFIFYSAGTKDIYCAAYNRQGLSSPSSRGKITIRPENQVPFRPKISNSPYNAETGKTVYISVTAGNDLDGDQVRVKCSAQDSNIADNEPYLSEWVAPQSTVNAMLTFYSSGNQTISCVTHDRKGLTSDESIRKINIFRPEIISHQDSCSCKHKAPSAFNLNQFQKNPDTCDVCGKKRTTDSMPLGDITYSKPYIPSYTNHTDYHQEINPVPSDLKGQIVYNTTGAPVQHAGIKVWDPISGRIHTATTDFNGQYSLDLDSRNYLIQATKGEFTSSIREIRINTAVPSVMDLTIMDRRRTITPQRQWSTPAPANNRVWQFN